jgi:hypothetical protein
VPCNIPQTKWQRQGGSGAERIVKRERKKEKEESGGEKSKTRIGEMEDTKKLRV